MTTAQKRELARRRRLETITLLGGKCVDCGEEDTDRLTFDHIYRTDRTWSVKILNRWQRQLLYRREAEKGRIALRCKSCHSQKSAKERRDKNGQLRFWAPGRFQTGPKKDILTSGNGATGEEGAPPRRLRRQGRTAREGSTGSGAVVRAGDRSELPPESVDPVQGSQTPDRCNAQEDVPESSVRPASKRSKTGALRRNPSKNTGGSGLRNGVA